MVLGIMAHGTLFSESIGNHNKDRGQRRALFEANKEHDAERQNKVWSSAWTMTIMNNADVCHIFTLAHPRLESGE